LIIDIDILGWNWRRGVFQLYGVDHHGHALRRSKALRAELLGAVRKLQPQVVAMEA
jgi:hypothetical protein